MLPGMNIGARARVYDQEGDDLGRVTLPTRAARSTWSSKPSRRARQPRAALQELSRPRVEWS
jgi:hypothetical protein